MARQLHKRDGWRLCRRLLSFREESRDAEGSLRAGEFAARVRTASARARDSVDAGVRTFFEWEASMKSPLKKTQDPSFVMAFFRLAALLMTASPLLAATSSFVVPNDIALQIRLDDTLTSVDSSVGDPFSATVVDQGEYQNAECTVISRRFKCRAKSKATPAWCFALTVW